MATLSRRPELSIGSLRTAARRLRRRRVPAGEPLPLSALRGLVDDDCAGAHWTIHPDGVLGRALVLEGGTAYTTPLRLGSEVRLTGRVMLLPHDWLNGRGELRATILITRPGGREARLWSAVLRAGDHGKPRGAAFDCPLPPDTSVVTLALSPPTPGVPHGVARALWNEPVLHDPSAVSPVPKHTAAPASASGSEQDDPAGGGPLISVLMPVHDPPPQMLQEAIESVLGQSYPNWELCIVDDGSRDQRIIDALRDHATRQPRIKLTTHDRARGISGATNSALALADGEFVALLDHDDALTPDALRHVADTIASDRTLDMVYSDEDVVAGGSTLERHPKPGWSPEHMRALMYTCHLGVYRRSLADELGGFESRFDGCQDYDFVLRAMEHTDRIAHIPRILYHWRAHPESTAGGDAKPYAYLAQPDAISAHLQRSRIEAEVQFAHLPGLHRIVHRIDPELEVELVLGLTAAEGDRLEPAARSWLAQAHPNWRVTIAADDPDAVARALKRAAVPGERIRLIETTTDADAAGALHRAALHATAEHLVLMQAPALGLTDDWLTRLLGYSSQSGIGAAGPVILTPGGRIQQAGIALPNGIPLYLNDGRPADAAQPVVYNLSAVSGVLATPRSLYERLDGVDAALRGLALIDYCLRAGDAGERTVLVPDARMQAPAGPLNDLPAIWQLRRRWAATRGGDPYYNPSFRSDRGDFIPR